MLFSYTPSRITHNKYASVLDANICNKHRKRLFAANYRKKMNSADVAVPFDTTFFLAEQTRN